MKKCKDCKEEKPKQEFSKNKSSKDGLRIYCKRCWNRRMKVTYWKYREKYLTKQKDPNRYKKRSAYWKAYYYADKIRTFAQSKIRREIFFGKLKRLPCEQCGDPKSKGHHDDYKKPLDVRWLCQLHHMAIHNPRSRE